MNFDSSSTQTPQFGVAPSGPTPVCAGPVYRLSEDVLRIVFWLYVQPDRRGMVWWKSNRSKAQYDTASRACTLASVCRSWRDIALNMRQLWAIVRISPTILEVNDVAAEHILDVVKMILGRSGDAPLSLILPWDTKRAYWQVEYPIPTVARRVLEEMCKHAGRWQRLKYQAPPGGERRWVLSLLFARPTPALEFVHVSSSRPVDEPQYGPIPLDGLLPARPRLQTAYLGVTYFFPFQTAATTLVDLAIDSHMPPGKLWDMLSHTPNLRTLRLAHACGKHGGRRAINHAALVATPIVLSSLERLEVRSGQLSKTLVFAALYTRTPNLSELSLPHSMIWKPNRLDRVREFISVNGDALTELTVWEDTPARSFDDLAALGVENFWVSLEVNTPQLVPNLRKLFMLGIVRIPGRFGKQAYNHFKATRNHPALNDEEHLEVTEQWAHEPVVARKPFGRGRPGMGLLTGYRPRYL